MTKRGTKHETCLENDECVIALASRMDYSGAIVSARAAVGVGRCDAVSRTYVPVGVAVIIFIDVSALTRTLYRRVRSALRVSRGNICRARA